ncbi:hypothetical protein Plec18167_007399 [Paecilomyces lecythidis]|uniref:F-box domain-containing protein n=1 Tax=Paecilomyces lecythidis TaxID=3004212 RepID=A0ABR3X480_9EURO
MALSHRAQLEQLPAELLFEIASYLDFLSLENLSNVSWTLRHVAAHRMFKCVSLPFLASDIEALKEMAGSPLAKVVKSLTFRVVPSVKNVSGKRELRKGLVQPIEKIYSRQTYFQDMEQYFLPEDMSYAEIVEHMSTICEEQSKLPKSSRALLSLATTLQQFTALKELGVDWRLDMADPNGLDIVFVRCRKPNNLCNKHLIDMITKVIRLRAKDNPITSLQFSARGTELVSSASYPDRHLLKDAFMSIRSLHLQAHDGPLRLMAHWADLPELRCLKMTKFRDIDLDTLDRLCRKSAKTLTVLHIETKNFVYRGEHYQLAGHIEYCRPITTFMHKIGKDMSLEEVKVQALNHPEIVRGQLEALLRGETIPHLC